jgi:hypothetical protein
MKRPLSLSDQQMRQIKNAARVLPVALRDQFLRDVAARLVDTPSDAAVMQAINSVFDRIPIFLA